MPRKVTNKILEMVEDGTLGRDAVILACLNYMAEADVEDMAHCNDFLEEDLVEEEPNEGSESGRLGADGPDPNDE